MSSPIESTPSNLPPFIDQLVRAGYVTVPQLQQAIALKKKTNRSLLEILPQVTGRPVPVEIARQFQKEKNDRSKTTNGQDYPTLELQELNWPEIEKLFQTLLPFEICRRYQILPLEWRQDEPKTLTLAMVDPKNSEVLDDLKRILRDKTLQFQRKAIKIEDYQKSLDIYRVRKQGPAGNRPQEGDMVTLVEQTYIFDETPSGIEEQKSPEEDLGNLDRPDVSPAENLLYKILVGAIESKAGEIHLEPLENQLKVRFRQDGVMRIGHEPIAGPLGARVIAECKNLAGLSPEKNRPQKGKIGRTFSGRKIDFRVSTVPGHYGEKITLKIFDSRSALWLLDELITIRETGELVKMMLERPSGLLLITAPPGEGYSTTFYSLLAQRNRGGVNISTVEESIERTLNGVTQVEVSGETGLEYETILRSFRDQDVDIIGIDRLGNEKIVARALESAATGHLVLSGLALDDAAGAIVHLNKLGDPESVSANLIGAIGQRLVRKLCPVCRLKHNPTVLELSKFGISPLKAKEQNFYKANALSEGEILQARERGRLCRHCNGAGYQGQIAVFEVIDITPTLRNQIARSADAETLRKTAQQSGLKTLLAYSLELVAGGYTTLEEIERTIKERPDTEPLSIDSPNHVAPKVLARLQEVERLLGVLNEEFQALKREIGHTAPTPTPTVIHEEFRPVPAPEIPKPGREMELETIVGPAIYEELTDPGDWDKLKNEIDPDKETIVSMEGLEDDPEGWEVNSSFRSVPDPWS